jgi:8-oxo-dGTP pyrophosphatase MutT (NUDIX family)
VVLLREGPDGPEVLMVRRTRGASFMADAHVFPGGRVDPEDGEGEAAFSRAAVRELAEEAAITVDPAGLVWFAHWITPSLEPKRFDTRFYLAACPDGAEARHDASETVAHLWATPAELMTRYGRGELKLPPPTLRTLEELAVHPTVEAALGWGRARQPVPILPKIVSLGASLAIVLPWDAEYAALPGEGQPIPADHPAATRTSRYLLEEGRWWAR